MSADLPTLALAAGFALVIAFAFGVPALHDAMGRRDHRQRWRRRRDRARNDRNHAVTGGDEA